MIPQASRVILEVRARSRPCSWYHWVWPPKKKEFLSPAFQLPENLLLPHSRIFSLFLPTGSISSACVSAPTEWVLPIGRKMGVQARRRSRAVKDRTDYSPS